MNTETIKKATKRMLTIGIITTCATLIDSCSHSPSAFQMYRPIVEKTLADQESERISRGIFHRVNRVRQGYGLDTLLWDDSLALFATIHAVEMGENGYISHDDYSGRKFSERVKTFFSRFGRISENCGFYEYVITPGSTQPLPEIVNAIVDGWMNSKGHRENMLDDGMKLTGVGTYIVIDSVCYSGDGKGIKKDGHRGPCCKIFITQNFSSGP